MVGVIMSMALISHRADVAALQIQTRLDLLVQSAAMMRVFAAGKFFKGYNAG